MPAPFTKWTLIAMALALAGAGTTWSIGGGAIFSPGALHAGDSTAATLGGVTSHAALGNRCGSCHPAPWSDESAGTRCLACHTDIQAEGRDSSGLHARLAKQETCISCHTEHRGAAGNLTRQDLVGIEHDAFGFSLAAHRETAQGARFTCADCHEPDRWDLPRDRCESCHRDYQPEFVADHVRDWGSDCAECHDGADRFSRGAFDHDRLDFPLTGAHRRTACKACHADVRALAGFGDAQTTCVGCHRADDEHDGSFGDDCGACHRTERWEDATLDHEFPLDHGEEGPIPCRTCHEERGNWESYTCYGCHEHTPARIRAEHEEEGIVRDLENCVRCHPTGREDEAEEGGRRTRGDSERDRRRGDDH